MGKAREAGCPERPSCEAEPPLRPALEGPFSPKRSTNIAGESDREPEGRLSVTEELTDSADQRVAVLKRIQELELEHAVPERREATKVRKRVLKEVQNLVDSSDTDQFKVSWLQSKVLELLSAQAKLEKELIPLRKRENAALRERDEAKSEAQKAQVVNSKLQELCRTLQQQNRDIVEQAKATVEQEQVSRQQMTEKVSETLKSVTERIEEQNQDRELQQKENADLRDRLVAIDGKWSEREDLFMRQLQAKDQAAALHQQQTVQQKEILQAAAEREADLQAQLGDMRSQISATSAVLENHLRNYAQYQQAIDRSNEALQRLQEDDKTKDATIKLLEKSKRLKDKQVKQAQQCTEQATAALTEALQRSKHLSQLVEAAGGEQQIQELPKLQSQNATLQKLSRALQDENKQLKTQLVSAGLQGANFKADDE